MDWYGDVLIELMAALGAALFGANAYALLRRRRDRAEAARESAVRSRPGSPVRKQVRTGTTGNLDEVPVGRTVAFMVIGLFVAISAIAALTA